MKTDAGGIKKNCVALIGIMGSGKTSVGRRLAEMTGRGFADTDEMAVMEAGKPTAQIFADDGEDCFREIESRAVSRACSVGGAVVATGGGAVLEPENAMALKENCVIVYLRVSPSAIWERIKGDGSRPLIAGGSDKEKISRLKLITRLREPIYAALADFAVDTTRLTVDETAGVLVQWLRKSGYAADGEAVL